MSKIIEKSESLVRGRGLRLELDPTIGAEGFRITDAGITGHDERGLLYGVGKFLRDPAWRGTSVPEKPLRAIYFASHFHNFYHDAPVADVCRYVEELALWGCNTLAVWFDMHHFHGMADPAAHAMVARLRAILQAAQNVGMSPMLLGLANEGFANSPVELRGDFRWKENGYTSDIGAYAVEICPSKPGGLELILKYRQQMLDAFRDVNLGAVCLWAYDQGGCTCRDCAPWGANGYLRASEAVAGLIRERYPTAKLILSTWYFDKHIAGEWRGLTQAFATKPAWVDYLLADAAGNFPEYPLQHGVPGGLPVVSFPEISMGGMWPWGGFGANPRPQHWQNYWQRCGHLLAGSFPYSEGIYEDFNKVLQLQLNWNGRQTTRAIAREYAAAEFSPAVADDVVTALEQMENALDHGADNSGTPHPYRLKKVTAPVTYAATLRRVDAELPATKRTAWRWRVMLLRALLDEELQRSAGKPTTQSDAYFAELTGIYHATNAEWLVCTPDQKTLHRFRPRPA